MISRSVIFLLFFSLISKSISTSHNIQLNDQQDNHIDKLFKRDVNSSATKTNKELLSLDSKETNKYVFDKNSNLNIHNVFENSTNLSKDNDQPIDNNTFIGQPLDPDYDPYNSTLDYDDEALILDEDQLLIDGYQPISNEKSFLIEELAKKLNQSALSVKVDFNCKSNDCDQKRLLIFYERVVLKYELIRQSIFLDKASKYYDYLNCFYVQYNPNFGLRSYLRSGFTFDFKKAYINTCFKNDTMIGKLYLTQEFKPFLNHPTGTVQLEYDHSSKSYILKLDKDNDSTKDHQAINNLKGVYSTYTHLNGEYLNHSSNNDHLNVLNKILNLKHLKDDKIKFLNQLNSSLFHNGLHQKLNKFKFLKAQILFDSGLLTFQDKENFKILNHLFQIIYESQNHFRQLNIYLVIVRLRFNLPNDLDIFSNTGFRLNASELTSKIGNSYDDTYFELPADFKILFTSFKFSYQNSSSFIPSFSHDLIGNPESFAALDFSYLKTNRWLLTYEVAHLLGLKDDSEECKCLSDHCIMNRPVLANTNELTWSNCSLKQFDANLKLFKFDFDLSIQRTEFNIDSFNRSVCGNGVLERGELCDCGKFGCFFYNQNNQTYQSNRCCNSTTCKLNESPAQKAQCASGSCCDLNSCKFHETGYVCRSSQDVCDIEEQCNGYSSLCPVDDYYVNGESCDSNRVCINKKCIGNDKVCINDVCIRHGEFSCEKILGEDAFESPTCLKKNMVATSQFNCGYSFADRRWISCKSIEEARCGSFQCAIKRNSTDAIRLKLGSSFDLIQTGTSVDKTHECALVVIKQNQYGSDKVKQIPFYPLDGKICSSNENSVTLKFCSNGACRLGSEFKELKDCLANAYCSPDQKCTRQNECRCAINNNNSSEFNFTSSYYCPSQRSSNINQKSRGLLDNFNFYHLLIVPCFAVVLVLASFLRSYLRSGSYKIRDTSEDELSISFSGPRPNPIWSKPAK